MNVPTLDFASHYAPIRAEVMSAIEQVIDSHGFILGPNVQAFEQSIANYCGAKLAIGVSSGSDALLVSLMALGIGPGDEVITTPYSFFATAGCISRLRATPVFVDIDPVTYNIDPERIEPVITPRTKAILPVHLYGQCADMDPILEIADAHNLAVVEDAAQAIGSQYRDGRSAGSIGDCGCFSFFPSKNLGGVGDGGMVVTNNDELAEKLRVLRVHGSKPKYYHHVIGGNFRLDAIQAAVLNVKLNYLNEWTRQRQMRANRYAELLAGIGLKDICPEAVYRKSGVDRYHIYNQFVIRVPGRDELQKHLRSAGIATAVYYPVPFHLQKCFASLGYQEGDFPQAEFAAQQTLALPISPELTDEQMDHVVASISSMELVPTDVAADQAAEAVPAPAFTGANN